MKKNELLSIKALIKGVLKDYITGEKSLTYMEGMLMGFYAILQQLGYTLETWTVGENPYFKINDEITYIY